MEELNGLEILETIEELYVEIRNKRLFNKKVISEAIAHLIGNEKYTSLDFIIDTDHSLLLSAKNKFKELVALKLYLSDLSEETVLQPIINEIKVQNYDQFFSFIQINDIKTSILSDDVLLLYIEEEICELSLLDIMLSYKPKSIEMEQELKIQITIKILDSLNFLHKQKLIHGNLKFSNVLQQSKVYKLSDQFLDIHKIVKKESLIEQQEDDESKNIEQYRVLLNCAVKAPEYIEKNEETVQSDLFTLGIMLLQIDNIQKFNNYATLEEFHSDFEKYFMQGQIPPTLQLQTDSIFYKNAIKMIKRNPSERMNSEHYLQKFMQHLKEKKMNMAIRVESIEIDYHRKLLNNSKLLLKTIESEKKKLSLEDDSIEQLNDLDSDLSHNFQDDIEEEKDQFDDGRKKQNIQVVLENNTALNPKNLQAIEQKQGKKSGFFNIVVTEERGISDDENNQDQPILTNRSPVIQSLNTSKINSPTKKPFDTLKIPSAMKLDGKSKFSQVQINTDEKNIFDENMEIKSVYSAHQEKDTLSRDGRKLQDDELSKHSHIVLDSPMISKQKRDSQQNQGKLTSFRERQNSDEIQKQFEENQKKQYLKKLQTQTQKSFTSQESPMLNQSPYQSQIKEQRNDLIILSKIVQDKKHQQQMQQSLLNKSGDKEDKSGGQSGGKGDDSLSSKIRQILSISDKKREGEGGEVEEKPISPDEILVEDQVEIMEEKDVFYDVQIKWNQRLQRSTKVSIPQLVLDIESKKETLQSVQLDFQQYGLLTGDELLNILGSIQQASKELKQLHLNFFENIQLTPEYMNLFLEKLLEKQRRCFLFFKNLFGLLDLNLKIDTPKVNGWLIKKLINQQQKTLVKLSLSLGQSFYLTKFAADKIIVEVNNCKKLQQIQISMPTNEDYSNHKKIKMKKIQHVSLISKEISYFRFTHNQNIQSIISKMEDFNKDNYSQNVLKIRLAQNEYKLSPENFSSLLNFISKSSFYSLINLNITFNIFNKCNEIVIQEYKLI